MDKRESYSANSFSMFIPIDKLTDIDPKVMGKIEERMKKILDSRPSYLIWNGDTVSTDYKQHRYPDPSESREDATRELLEDKEG